MVGDYLTLLGILLEGFPVVGEITKILERTFRRKRFVDMRTVPCQVEMLHSTVVGTVRDGRGREIHITSVVGLELHEPPITEVLRHPKGSVGPVKIPRVLVVHSGRVSRSTGIVLGDIRHGSVEKGLETCMGRRRRHVDMECEGVRLNYSFVPR